MAEALAKRLYGHTAYLNSVGVHASELDNFAVAVLDEIGIDLHAPSRQVVRRHRSELVRPDRDAVAGGPSPRHGIHPQRLDRRRILADPRSQRVEGSREARLEAYRRTRDLILGRLKARFGAPSGPNL